MSTRPSYSSCSVARNLYCIRASLGVPTATPTVTPTATPTPLVLVWRSYDLQVNTSITIGTIPDANGSAIGATVQFYTSSNNFGVDIGTIPIQYCSGLHGDSFNEVSKFWSTDCSSSGYPYVGKSATLRGFGGGESNTPSPTGVYDVQFHPPLTDQLIVASLIIPQAASCSMTGFAARRVSNLCGDTVTAKVFGPAKILLASIQATNNRAWVSYGSPISF